MKKEFLTTICALLMFLLWGFSLKGQNFQLGTVEQGDNLGVFYDGPLPLTDSFTVKWNCNPIHQHNMYSALLCIDDTLWLNGRGRLNIFAIAQFQHGTSLSQNIVHHGPEDPTMTFQNMSSNGNLDLNIETNGYKTTVVAIHPYMGMAYYYTTNTNSFTVQKQLPTGTYIILVKCFHHNMCEPHFTYKLFINL